MLAAVVAGDAAAVAGCLSRGADPNAADGEGYTLLCEAALAGALDVVRLLLQHGARPADAGPEGTPLMLAIDNKHAAVADCLLDWRLETGGDVGIHVRNTAGGTALHLSIYGPGISVVRGLLEAGADPNTRCLGNWSPLTAAAGSPDGLGFELQAAEALIDRGAAMEPKTEPEGCTALLQACFRGNYDIASLLVRRGADVNATTTAGYGVLANVHLYPIELVRLLLDAGAGPKHGDIIRLLLDAGADPDVGSNSNDWSFIAAVVLQWRGETQAALERERAARAASEASFRFALPHLLAAAAGAGAARC